jgi:hypothetical protein
MNDSRPLRTPRRSFRFFLALIAFSLGVLVNVQAQQGREYDLKAVFLYRFLSFVEWPLAALPPETEPFVIGILGEDPFGVALRDIVNSDTVRNRRVEVRHLARVQDADTCHIVFVSRSEGLRISGIVRYLRDKPVLTVSDADRFAAQGGMIGFDTVGSKMQVVVNLPAVQSAKLSISSKLLRLARVIGG